ncbi:MAG: DpnD/PcfM family protein [Clostridium celatum]|uniref:DpnD/PcfM family protein n=1 Tax=Clostridium tertium TaxID=1559 RepID=UPI002900D0F9|nr:DpnD/PcfM family protein [Clostridium celatum]
MQIEKKFKISIQEVLEKNIIVLASSEVQAIMKVQEMYKTQEIILDSENHIETKIFKSDAK